MFKVVFNTETVFHARTVEDAIAMALSIHQASNVEHLVGVFEPDTDLAVVSLKKSSDVSA